MSLDQDISLFTALIAFVGLIAVYLKLRESNRQREVQSRIEIYDINRELISLAFSHPPLLAVLHDAENADPIWEQHYLQLWLNQLSLIHHYLRRGVFDADLNATLLNELEDFLTHKNMQRFWRGNSAFYPVSFQRLVNGLIEKGEPPKTAHLDSGCEDLPGDLLEGRTRHLHEGFPVRRAQDVAGGGSRHVALDEHIAVVGQNGGRAGATMTELREGSIFPNDLLNFHNVIFKAFRSLKQNYLFCFNDPGGAFV